MIKNWFVKTKQIRNSGKKYKYIKSYDKVKKKMIYTRDKSKAPKTVKDGFKRHLNYLLNNKNAQHQDTTINVICNNSHQILNAIEDRKLARQDAGLRGGGVVNYASSFVLSLPADVKHPSKEEWTEISKYIIKAIAKANNLKASDVMKHCVVINHDESKHGLDKHGHIHVLASNVINGEYIKTMTQNKTTNAVKRAFNKAVLNVLDVSHKNYTPHSNNVGDTPLWKARLDKANKVKAETERLEKENAELEIIKQNLQEENQIIEDSNMVQKSFVWTVKSIFKKWMDTVFKKDVYNAEKLADSVSSSMNDLKDKEPKIIREMYDTAEVIEENFDLPDVLKITNKVDLGGSGGDDDYVTNKSRKSPNL